ncbi:MAG: hypothetical protein PHY02_01875 [Phycisphaerae bacterium]|nr:hypothetical protein [Phycisphaerae bacterium]
MGCDEATRNKYNWQVVYYNPLLGEKYGWCRQSSLNPEIEDLWEPWQGEPGPCKLEWWWD